MRITYGHSTILSNLEPLFLSGLESKHRTIVNGAIRLWNATFADCTESLDYPPKIKSALLRLRPVADLQLPFFPESTETDISEEHRQPLTFAETQDDSINFLEPIRLDSILSKESMSALDSSRDRKSTPQALIHGEYPTPGANKRSREETPEMGIRLLKKRVPTPKLRHDDSQIQFEAIDSSPIVDEALESQLLTDRQREVKERQKVDAAMFPDLRSSPRSRGTPSTPELPLHRSVSKPRSISSPGIARQTTPTLILQAEEDDFVNSSPTPTRANTSEPPSSPPEASTKQQVATYDEESDIPSSPPEIIENLSSVHTTPLFPSAQFDPYAIETTRTVSTYEDTPGESIQLKTSSASGAPLKAGRITRRSAADVHPSEAESVSKPNQITESTSVLDINSLPDGQDGSATDQQSNKTPIFHDALTSPVSSDGHAANTEVFEDAVSSPHLDTGKTTTEKASSPISDFDESSMLRLVKEYDQGSGRPRRSVRLSTGKENQPAEPLVSTDSPCPTRSSDAPAESATGGVHRPVAVYHDKTDKPRQEPNLAPGIGSQSSSFPSLIPETPGVKERAFVTDDGDELDPDETIFVETPDDYEPYASSRRRRSRALFTRIRNWSVSPASKKRKHEEATGAEGEVPDSQGHNFEGMTNRERFEIVRH